MAEETGTPKTEFLCPHPGCTKGITGHGYKNRETFLAHVERPHIELFCDFPGCVRNIQGLGFKSRQNLLVHQQTHDKGTPLTAQAAQAHIASCAHCAGKDAQIAQLQTALAEAKQSVGAAQVATAHHLCTDKACEFCNLRASEIAERVIGEMRQIEGIEALLQAHLRAYSIGKESITITS